MIAADTIVEIDNQILEKPASHEDAKRMLRLLSGKQHKVHTAVAIFGEASNAASPSLVSSFVSTSLVKFATLTEADIHSYVVEANESMDKSGAYGIQAYGSQLVEDIDGCYFNIMGLPVHRLSRELARLYSSGLV
jgi:septum formation protein